MSTKTKAEKKLEELQEKKITTEIEEEMPSVDKEISTVLQDVQKNFVEKEITSLVRIQKSKGISASTLKLRERLQYHTRILSF